MSTIWVREFKGGLDARRLPEATDGGVLIKATDCHVNRGGEIEKRAASVPTYELPACTASLAADSAGIYVFGSIADPGVPAGVTYQRLQNGAKVLDRVKSWDLFQDDIYAIALYTDDTLSGFYNGAIDADSPSGGTFVMTIGAKEYIAAGAELNSSEVENPEEWTTGTGVGFIDMSQYSSGAETITALADYQNATAVFSERLIQIWQLASDPADSVRSQVLRNTGTASPKSVTQFGDGDVFYIDESGLRSLRARDSSNAAATSGIGIRIDPLIVAKLRSLTAEEREKVIGLIEPLDGRFWLIMKDVIYVFTFFPEEKISAWTSYTPHYFDGNGDRVDFEIDDAVVFNRRVYLRSGDDILVYGGLETGAETDETEAEAWLPFLDGEAPARAKQWQSFDAAVSGQWSVSASTNLREPTSEAVEDDICVIYRSTYNEEGIGVVGESTHISLRFRSSGSGACVVSSCAIHFTWVDGKE